MMVLKDERGFSLTWFAFAASALLLIVLAGLLVVRPLFILRQAPPQQVGLQFVSNYMRACILNNYSWTATVMDPDNKSMECLRKNTECDTTAIRPPASYIKLKATPGNGDFCYQKFNTMPGVNTDGFDKKGISCVGFRSEGNDACPYRFNAYWTAECPGGEKKCRNPIVRVNGDFVTGSNTKKNADGLDLTRFALRTVRGRTDQTKYFMLYETSPAGEPAASAPCKLTGSPRMFNLAVDPGGYAELRKDGAFTLAPGSYACNISVPGYRVGGFKAMLVDLSTKQPKPILAGTSEFSSAFNSFAQTRSEISGGFILNKKSILGVVQICNGGAGQPAEQLRSLGVPIGLNKKWEEIYSVLQCWVL